MHALLPCRGSHELVSWPFIPADRCSATLERAVAPGLHVKQESRRTLAKTRILLVEDEYLIRSLLSEVLIERDFEVVEAANGEEAFALFAAGERFDLLLTDVHMPGRFNGLDVARRARMRQPELPVVFATGRPDSLTAFGDLSVRDVQLQKPFTLVDALSAVERLVHP